MELQPRRRTPVVQIGPVAFGGDHPVAIQSMTDTPTANIAATYTQTIELIEAGSELVRWTVNEEPAAQAVPDLVKRLRDNGIETPIVGDFHFNGHTLLMNNPACAQALSKYRINPGNVGRGKHRDENFITLIKIAIDNGKPVRIGVNRGSLDQDLLTANMDANAASTQPKEARQVIIETMIQSALLSAELAESTGLAHDRIVLSAKMSVLQDMVTAYTRLARRCDYPLHLGLTEAGGDVQGISSSSAALAILLQQGIGDVIRVSLTPQPNVTRTREVEVCKQLLQSLGLRYFRPSVTSCPGCGRTTRDYFRHLARDVNDHIESRMPQWKTQYPGVEKLKVAVMGCVVYGPGESSHADIGISLPGAFEAPTAPVYIDGERFKTLKGDHIKEEFLALLEKYIKEKYSSASAEAVKA